MKRFTTLLLAALALTVGMSSVTYAATPAKTKSPATQTIVDMNGRRVTVPTKITRIADTGTDPVLNSVLMMFGGEHTLVNALTGTFAKVGQFESTLDPSLSTLPVVEEQAGTVNTELLATLNPQVVFTNNLSEISPLTAAGFTVVYISWTSIAGLEQAVQLCGKILGYSSLARQYIKYFNAARGEVEADTKKVPAKSRPTTIYLQSSPLEEAAGGQIRWWGSIIGANNVAAPYDQTSSPAFSSEQILEWNPQVMFVQSPTDYTFFTTSPIYANVSAIENHRVYVMPEAILAWGNETSESPLVLYWGAKMLFPKLTKNIHLSSLIEKFYETFYHYKFSAAQIKIILTRSGVL